MQSWKETKGEREMKGIKNLFIKSMKKLNAKLAKGMTKKFKRRYCYRQSLSDRLLMILMQTLFVELEY